MPGPGFTTLFGGNLIAPAIPTYLPLNISTNVVLNWPTDQGSTTPICAEIIDVTATAGGLTVQLSDARQTSTGYCALFNNVGVNTFTVLDAQGNTLMTVASGQAWQIYLADNSTLQGTYRVFQYGAGVSNANAASLAGAGLKAITTTLNERIVINPQAGSYSIVNGDRASCIDYTGGSGNTLTLPTPASVGSDWFCYIKNSGTGLVTLNPSAGLINGSSSVSFNINDSAILATDGTNFFTIGFGQSVASTFSFVSISLAGQSGNFTLAGAQLNRISYKFTGALAGNINIVVPSSIQQYWVDNETTGAFTLTVTTGGGGTQTIAQGSRNILYCDGLNVVNAVTAGAGGITLVADGSAAAPGLAWASDTQMGLYKVAADTLGFSTAGTARGQVNSLGNWAFNAPSSGQTLNLTVLNNITGLNISDGTEQLQQQTDAGHNFYWGTAGAHALNLFTNNTTRIAIGSAGNVTVQAPSSGNTLQANAAAGTYAVVVNGAAGSFAGINFQENGVSKWGFDSGQLAAGTLSFVSATTVAATLSIAQAGNVTIAAPTSGNNLIIPTINGLGIGLTATDLPAITLTAGGAVILSLRAYNGGTAGLIGTTTNHALNLRTNDTDRLIVSNSGNVSINAPGSGTALSVTAIATGIAQKWTDGTVAAQLDFNATLLEMGTTSAHTFGFFTNNATRMSITSVGDVTINAPGSGIAFTVNGSNGNNTILAVGNGGDGGATILSQNDTGGLAVNNSTPTRVVTITTVKGWTNAGVNVTDLAIGARAVLNLYAGNSSTAAISIATSGAVTISAPTSALDTVVASSNGAWPTFYQSSTAAIALAMNSSGSNFGMIQNDGANLWSLATATVRSALGTPILQWTPTPQILGRGPVAAALVDMTPDKGSWTTTLSGPWVAGNNPTGTLKWERQGTQVTIWCDTSISQTATITATISASALPASITPSSNRQVAIFGVEDNGVQLLGEALINSTGTITFLPLLTRSGANPQGIQNGSFSGVGTTGILAQTSFTYSV